MNATPYQLPYELEICTPYRLLPGDIIVEDTRIEDALLLAEVTLLPNQITESGVPGKFQLKVIL